MPFRTVIVAERAKLEARLGYLVVRGETEKRVHLSEIDTLIVESTASALTSGLLRELSDANVNVIFCDEKHLPCSQLVPLYGNFNASGNIARQIGWDAERKTAAWTEIVGRKIRMQAGLLLKRGRRREYETLAAYARELKKGDSTNREGHAAKVYFNALFGLDFSRNSENDFNPPLNYGYAILLSLFAREIVAAGYLTQIGIWHRNEFNFFNLACDFMEPFRPVADDAALSLTDAADFKRGMRGIVEAKVIMDGREWYLPAAARTYARGVLNFINRESDAIPAFEEYFLKP